MAIYSLVEAAAEIVVAFISHNAVPMNEVPSLIESVHTALSLTAEPGQRSAAVVDPRAPAVSVRRSVTPDYLICLDDGKRFKSMRRHLALLGMTPEQYRAKWGLPADYPIVAANYAAKRSEMAKSLGFGKIRKKSVAAPVLAPAQLKFGRLCKATT